MFTGKRPWEKFTDVAAMYQLGTEKKAPPISDKIKMSAEARDMLDKCFIMLVFLRVHAVVLSYVTCRMTPIPAFLLVYIENRNCDLQPPNSRNILLLKKILNFDLKCVPSFICRPFYDSSTCWLTFLPNQLTEIHPKTIN